MNGTESEGFEPEGLEPGFEPEDELVKPCGCLAFVEDCDKCRIHPVTAVAGAPSRAVVLAALPAKWRAEAEATWNGDGFCPDGYIDGIQRRRAARTLLDCAEELDAAIAGLGGAL